MKSNAIKRTRRVLRDMDEMITDLEYAAIALPDTKDNQRRVAHLMEAILRSSLKRLQLQLLGYRANAKGITD